MADMKQVHENTLTLNKKHKNVRIRIEILKFIFFLVFLLQQKKQKISNWFKYK